MSTQPLSQLCSQLFCQPHRSFRPLWMFAAAVLLFFQSATVARAHQIPAGCTGSGLGISLFADKTDAHVGDTVCYSVLVLNTPFPACQADNIVAAIVTPDGVSHNIPLLRTTLNPGESDFYTNVACYVVRAQDVRADSTVRATASDTGRIHQNDTDSQGGGNQGVNTVVNFPCLLVTKTCTGGIGENGAIIFNGTVRNCGNTPLVNVTVTNLVNGISFLVLGPTNLATNQVITFQGSYVPFAPCGPTTDTLFAQGSDTLPFPSNVVSSATATCSNLLTPRITVTQTCPAPVAPGATLTYSGTVSNSGNVTLTNIIVLSDHPAANTTVFTIATLAPGASASFTGSYTAPASCSSTSQLNARGTSVCGVTVTDTTSSTCPILTTPQIVLTAICSTNLVTPGGIVNYSGTVRNAGDITVTNVVVTSDRPGANTVVFSVATLAPGASANFNASYAAPLNTCAVTANLAATAKDVCAATPLTSLVTLTCPVTTAPAVSVTLACPPVSVAPGSVISYTGTVRNAGNITLNNVTVVNAQAVPPTVITIPSLAPGASTNFTTSFSTPADSCSVTATVVGSGTDACTGAPVTSNASATCALATTPRIVVTQNCPAGPASLGGVLTYSGVVSNAGNITLTNIVVVNDHTGATAVFTLATLAPGATAVFTGSYPVPANNSCSIASTVTATANDKCAGTRVTSSATSTCPVLGAPTIAVSLTCPSTSVLLGGTLTYSGVVSNTGNITLTNVVVVSQLPNPGTVVFTRATLAPGTTATFTGSFTTPTTDACSVTTSVTASANDQCGGTTVSQGASITCPLVATPRISVFQICPPIQATPGGLLVYSGTVSNAGNVTLTNITVVNNQSSPPTIFSLATLAPGATANFNGSLIAPLDACSVNSTLIASGQNQCNGAAVTNSVTSTCSLTTSPQISVTKSCPVQPPSAGGLLVFTGTVTNTGNVTLANVMVYNTLPAANTRVLGPITLAPGAGTNFTGSYTAPLNTCSVTDTLTATGQGKCGTTVTNTATATCPIVTTPRVSVTLACPPTSVATGGLITYTGTVRNSGDVTLNNVSVTSVQAVPNGIVTIASLAPGVSTNFTMSFTAPADSCSVSATVIASGSDNCTSFVVTNSATATCTLTTAPRITVTQNCPPVPPSPGSLLTYSGTVSNAGNITLTNVVVVNDRTGTTPVFTLASLAPGASAGFTGSYVVPTNACATTSSVTASGNDKCTGAKVSAQASATCPIQTKPGIFVYHFCPPNPPQLGTALIFSGIVSNSGNITLTNIVVVNDHVGTNPISVIASLAPGATANFSGSFLAPIDCCQVSSTVTATGRDICTGTAVSDSTTRTCPVVTTPGIVVTKVCRPGVVELGDLLRFSGTVSNSGNITLTNVTVVNNRGSTSLLLLGPITLAPHESVTYAAAYTLPDDFCGVDNVVAQGSDVCTGQAVVSLVSVTCPVMTSPRIVLTKSCPVAPAFLGDLFTYSGTVSNAGNVTLTNLFVVDDHPANNTPVIGPITLAPGAWTNFFGSYTAPIDCCETVDTLTARAQDNCTGQPVTATASAFCRLLSRPAITVTRNCPAGTVGVGGLFAFTGTVRNTGDITLTNVLVVSIQSGVNVPVLGPFELAPGESQDFDASYTVAAGADPLADLVMASGTAACSGLSVSVRANCSGIVSVAPVIASVNISSGMVTVSWVATPGVRYMVQSKGRMSDASWTDVGGSVTATGSTASKSEPMVRGGARLYRVKIVQ